MLKENYLNQAWLDPKNAALYDWIDSYTSDLDMWLLFAQNFPKPILELGCGTARVLLHLARNGIAACGLDFSPQMLQRANWKLAIEKPEISKLVTIKQDDMTTFTTDKKYGFIFIACNTINTIYHPLAQLKTIQQCANALLPNGVLAISNSINWRLSNEEATSIEEAERILHVSGISPFSNNPMKCFGQSFLDIKTGLVNYMFEVEEELQDHSVILTRLPEEGYSKVRRIQPFEIIDWYQKCNLSVFAQYGTFDLQPFNAKVHHRLILLGRKH